ncbi:Carrier domain-containing protein OS=Streptomyces microflavus OX=1919 GN=Smic_75330 PE=4 SV=1 [Streptomyces microflavus]
MDVTRLRTGGSEEAPGVVPDPAAEAGELSPQAATLLAAYRSVLGRENVRPDDSFFDLGATLC